MAATAIIASTTYSFAITSTTVTFKILISFRVTAEVTVSKPRNGKFHVKIRLILIKSVFFSLQNS